MNTPSLPKDVELVCNLAKAHISDNQRTLIAIAGPPASGKSTLAEAVVDHLNRGLGPTDVPLGALLPMDGYHLDNDVLQKRGLLARKGAPETFDAAGFCKAVKSLAESVTTARYPSFDRDKDAATQEALLIQAETPIVVVEGNYLLLKSAPWASLRILFAKTIFISPPMDMLVERLEQRWVDHGFDPVAARQRARSNDVPNAQLVLSQSAQADVKIDQGYSLQLLSQAS